MAEWLRRWTANPLCSARVGSNPILVGSVLVNHQLLPHTLADRGIARTALKCFSSYLTDPSCQLCLVNRAPEAKEKDHVVVFDSHLPFKAHMTDVTRSCTFTLYNIRRITLFLAPKAKEKDYVVVLDSQLPLKAHITAATRSCAFTLCNIRRIRLFLTEQPKSNKPRRVMT